MGSKLFFAAIAAIVVLAFIFVVRTGIVTEVYTQVTPAWVIAIFTIVLTAVTSWNIKVTQGLLRQSRAASRQSRAAFLIDTIIRISQYTESREQRHLNSLIQEIDGLVERTPFPNGKVEKNFIEDWTLRRTSAEVDPYYKGLSKAVRNISKNIGIGLDKAIEDYIVERSEAQNSLVKELEEYRDRIANAGSIGDNSLCDSDE